MNCPKCGAAQDCGGGKVIDSRPAATNTRRRRVCNCGHRFTTYERAAELPGLNRKDGAEVAERLRELLRVMGGAAEAVSRLAYDLEPAAVSEPAESPAAPEQAPEAAA